ncbi:MAG: hypothetical protein ACREDR_01460 [Blastocatellia bacterium]
MSTETITMEVDSEAANLFRGASAEERKKMEALVAIWLMEIGGPGSRPLQDILNDIGEKASKRGMTPEILSSMMDSDQ